MNKGTFARFRRLPVGMAIFVIELYRTYVSPMRLPTCRFTPTCSEYAVEALTEYGLVRGGWLTAVRLAKCGPWHRGGWDPIPERHNKLHRHADESLVPRAHTADEPLVRRAHTADESLARRAHTETGHDGRDASALRGEGKPGV